jgi:predicted branched-subunit amino acid permease
MAGVVAIIIALVVVPVGFIMSMTAVAGLLGTLLTRDGAARHEGSELLELNR